MVPNSKITLTLWKEFDAQTFILIFFSSIKIQEYIQQIFNWHVRLQVTKIYKNVSDTKKLQ